MEYLELSDVTRSVIYNYLTLKIDYFILYNFYFIFIFKT